MQIRIEQEDDLVRIALEGELDQHAAPYVREQADKLLTTCNARRYLLDLSELDFMDSSGIGVIIGRYKNIQALSGEMCIVCRKPQILKILEMSGIGKIIPIYETAAFACRKWGDKCERG